jgi:hypothetical protein
MKRMIFIALIVLVGIHLPMKLDAAIEHSRIEALIARIEEPSIPVTRETLEEIAFVTYSALAEVPLSGIRKNQATIETLITVKQLLHTHHGMLDHLLAIRMQMAIDRTIGIEVTRRAVHHLGIAVVPPYQEDSLTPDIVIALLKNNEMAAYEAIQYIKNLNGRFAQFCKAKNFSVENFLEAEAVLSFPPDLRESLKNFRGSLDRVVGKMERLILDDFLFASTLTAIDQANDIRVWCDVLLYEQSGSHTIVREKIEQHLQAAPYSRVSSGNNNRAAEIFSTANTIKGENPEDYPEMLTVLFYPFFSNAETISAHIGTIFFQYTGERENFTQYLPGPGAWLELVQ